MGTSEGKDPDEVISTDLVIYSVNKFSLPFFIYTHSFIQTNKYGFYRDLSVYSFANTIKGYPFL